MRVGPPCLTNDEEKRKVRSVTQLDHVWRKSSRSNNNGACVEVRQVGDMIQVRDTKSIATGAVLGFTPDEWDAFVAGVKNDEFATA